MPHRMRKAPGDPLEVREHAVAPLIMETSEGGIEELAVIHRENLARKLEREAGYAFLERFQLCCRAGIGRQNGPHLSRIAQIAQVPVDPDHRRRINSW